MTTAAFDTTPTPTPKRVYRSQAKPQPARVTPQTPRLQLPQFLTIEQVMAYLSVSRHVAYQLARDRGVQIGSRLWRIPREAIGL
jgi:hypothetical protein